jgi:hypothetical protein
MSILYLLKGQVDYVLWYSVHSQRLHHPKSSEEAATGRKDKKWQVVLGGLEGNRPQRPSFTDKAR